MSFSQSNKSVMSFVAFPATEYDEVLSGYQPGQMVERCKNQRFEEHLSSYFLIIFR
jgi:hypothetical protein